MLSLLASARLIRLRPLPLTRGVQLGAHMTQDPEVMDKEKDKSLKGKVKSSIKGAPGWNEKLASVAEAVVSERSEPPERSDG